MAITLTVRAGMLLGMLLGLALTVWLVIASNATNILDSFVAVGWGTVAVVSVRATVILTNGVAWARLNDRLDNAPPHAFMLVRWMREAINAMLPVASIGGEVAAVRALTFWDVPGALATASVVADLLLQVTAQVIFATLGALLLAKIVGASSVLASLFSGLAIGAITIAGFFLVQRYGAGRLFDWTILFVSKHFGKGERVEEPAVQQAVDTIWHGRQLQVAGSLGLHLLAWTIGTLEVLIALMCMGRPVGIPEAIILESLGTAISCAAFFIPGSWGIQEAGYVFVGHLLGVPAQEALALSFVKRVPDFALGIPGLLTWYLLEAKRLFRPAARSSAE